MSNYPGQIDDDSSIPAVNNNLSQIGSDAINALRSAVFQIETVLGTNIAGSQSSLASRLSIFINPDGSPNTSVLFSLGLITLPITNSQVSATAGIVESKLTLDYRTQDLFNYIRDLSKDVNLALGWISISGSKLEPHLIGALYRHDLAQIDVAETSIQFLNNVFRVNRDNTDAYTVINDINNELISHQWADGSPLALVQNIITNDGSVFPSNYGHTASGIFLNTSRFISIPQTAQDVQAFADYIDSISVLTLGTRIQNLYANGISRNSRSSTLTTDGYGQALVPITPAIAFLRGTDNLSLPLDDIAIGDDIVQFIPSASSLSSNEFDSQFALVRPGDIIRVAYAGDGYNVEVPYVISEKKYIQGVDRVFIVRIAGKNIAYAPNATARIDRPLFNNDKQGVLAVSAVNSPSITTPSLIVGTARGAQCLGVGFSPDQFNETHYFLYLALYPTGNPLDSSSLILPGIDLTGNQGTTPGSYTLDSIVAACNNAFQQPGYNYRFLAFQQDGQFGIMLADSYNDASFSVISAIVKSDGTYDQTNTHIKYPQNVIDVFPTTGTVAPDPLGFGSFGAGIASPPFSATFGSTAAALLPTLLFTPLRRNNFYVNGNELERLSIDVDQSLDVFGDGYWVATVDGYTPNGGPPGHMLVTYNIPLDLSASGLKAGKTIVVQPFESNLGETNYGRFIIQSIIFTCCPPVQTQITVFDGVHGQGFSPSAVANVGSLVAIYSNSDSVSFNNETATDFTPLNAVFKRSFEVYIDGNANTFTHERARFSLNGNVIVNGTVIYSSDLSLAQLDLVLVSPTLRGYQFGTVNKITLSIISFDPVGGILTANLCSYDGVNFTHPGPVISGKIGEVIRFYDETNVDYLDVFFDVSSVIPILSNQVLDIQLFPSLQLDQEIMVIASCQERTDIFTVNQIKNLRQFGNTSEQQFTTSAIDFINTTPRLLHFNGVVRGFDLSGIETYNQGAAVLLTGGLALVEGNFNALNDQFFTVPPIQETFNGLTYPLNFALCVNEGSELVIIGLTDFDAVLATPNSPNRVISVINEVSSTTYHIDSCSFSYLLNNRKDLTALYIVSSTVIGTGLSAITIISLRDVRRFINDSDASVPAVLTNDNSQGNFKSLTAAINWLTFNNNFQNDLQIKGAFTLAADPGLTFPLNVEGAGANALLVFNSSAIISNVVFSNLSLIFNATLNATNVSFQNCNISFNGITSLTTTIINKSIVSLGNVIITTQSSITNSTVNVSTITSNGQAIVVNSGSNFAGITFNYTANPVGTGTYDTTNLVNTSAALIYASVSSSLTNLNITKCSFISTLADHYPFISLQLTTNSAIIQDVVIADNQFTSQTLTNDLRAVVAITSTVLTLPPSNQYPKHPKLVSVKIKDNTCNMDQMIVVSTDRQPALPIENMLTAINCQITGNTCGTIGFITANSEVSHSNDSNVANGGFVRNKPGQLLISDNSCKLITHLDSMGDYIFFGLAGFPFSLASSGGVPVPTGPYTVVNNTVNWIQVGCSLISNGAGLAIIANNQLTPNDPSYLNNYTDTFHSGSPPVNVGILLSAESELPTGPQSLISQNIITQNPLVEIDGSTNTFYYNAGIVCYHNVQMVDNNVFGVLNSGGAPMIYLGPIGNSRITGNILTRNNLAIQAYVVGNFSANGNVSIVNNTFDSQWVDVNNTIEQAGLDIPDFWEFRNNVNQVFYVEFPLIEQAFMTNVGGLTATNSNPGPGTPPPIVPTNANYEIKSLNNGQFLVNRMPDFNGIYDAPTSQYLQLVDSQSAAPFLTDSFSKTFGIDYLIPPNSRLLNANMGVYMSVVPESHPQSQILDYSTPFGTTDGTFNCITLSIMQYNSIPTSNSVHGVLDVFNNINLTGGETDKSLIDRLFTNYAITNFNQEHDIRTFTQYTPIDLSIKDYRTGQSYRIAISVDITFLRVAVTNNASISFYVSPVVIKALYGA